MYAYLVKCTFKRGNQTSDLVLPSYLTMNDIKTRIETYLKNESSIILDKVTFNYSEFLGGQVSVNSIEVRLSSSLSSVSSIVEPIIYSNISVYLLSQLLKASYSYTSIQTDTPTDFVTVIKDSTLVVDIKSTNITSDKAKTIISNALKASFKYIQINNSIYENGRIRFVCTTLNDVTIKFDLDYPYFINHYNDSKFDFYADLFNKIKLRKVLGDPYFDTVHISPTSTSKLVFAGEMFKGVYKLDKSYSKLSEVVTINNIKRNLSTDILNVVEVVSTKVISDTEFEVYFRVLPNNVVVLNEETSVGGLVAVIIAISLAIISIFAYLGLKVVSTNYEKIAPLVSSSLYYVVLIVIAFLGIMLISYFTKI